MELEAAVDQHFVRGDRITVAGQHQLDVHLPRGGQGVQILERVRAFGRGVAGRVMSGVRGHVPEQVVRRDQAAPLAA